MQTISRSPQKSSSEKQGTGWALWVVGSKSAREGRALLSLCARYLAPGGGRGSLGTVLLCSELMGAGEGVASSDAAALIPQLPLTYGNSRSREGSWSWKSMNLHSRAVKYSQSASVGRGWVNLKKSEWCYSFLQLFTLFPPHIYVSEPHMDLICTRACTGQYVFDPRNGEWDDSQLVMHNSEW